MKPAIGVYHLTVLLAAFSTPLVLHADVVVIVNRTLTPVEFVATTSIAPPQKITLAAGDVVTIPLRAEMQLSCSAARPTDYPLSANSAYFFQRTPDETLTFREIDLQADASTRSGRDLGDGAVWDVSAVIPVKLLVDDEEPAARKKWEARLRGRLEAAAEIFLERFRVRFEVVAVVAAPVAPERSADDELLAAARRIVQQLGIAARANANLPLAAGAGNDPLARRTGDELTAYYVRQASQAALGQDPKLAPRALLLALGIGLDDSDLLVSNPLLEPSCRGIETATERADRIRVLGQPTVHGRRDLAQHFFVSGLLAAVWGTAAAEAAGVAKEILDAHGESGFSFADLAADQGGITFGKHILTQKLSLRDLAGRFTVADFAPPISGLPENLRWEAFVEQFGSVTDERCQRLRQQIQDRTDQLPGYRAAKASRVDSDPND